MRLFSIFFILILSASCGKDSGGGNNSNNNRPTGPNPRQEQTNDGLCPFEGRRVDCTTINSYDGVGIDLLEAMVEVPISITGNQITFLADRAAFDQGRRTSCKVSVKNGEVYNFVQSGDTLQITNSDGTYTMNRFSSGADIQGTWGWESYIADGTRITRQLSILGMNKAIVKTQCER